MVKLSQGRRSRQEPTAARVCAYRVLERTFDEGAYADKAFRAEADRAGLDGRDRAFAQRLAYGAIQHRRTLDYVVTALSARTVDSIDTPLLNALRLGIYQVALLDGVPDHAAVDQTVDLAKHFSRSGHRLVNAVMRRATREAGDLIAELTDNTPAEAAVRHSHPEWVVRMWWDVLGREETVALLERDNSPAESAVRANELFVTAGEVAAQLAEQGIETQPADDLPEGLVLNGPFDVHGSKLFKEGAVMPQSRASMLVARVRRPAAGRARARPVRRARREDDASGRTHGKRRQGRRGREARRPREVADRELRAPRCDVRRGQRGRRRRGGGRVRPRAARSARARISARSSRVRTCAGRRTRPLSRVSWPSRRACWIRPRTASARAARSSTPPARSRRTRTSTRSTRFLERHGDFRDEERIQLLPHRDGTDGFFIARMRKAG